MKTQRLEAFTDGVVAIIITIMVLELPVPEAAGMTALQPVGVLFAAYAIAFIKVGMYWMNHHHMVHAARQVNGTVLLANLLLLFWLSLVPYVVRWIGEAGVTRDTVAAFGVLMFLCALSYALLKRALVAADSPDCPVAQATGSDLKGRISILAYALAIGMAFVWLPLAIVIYLAIAAMWTIPDKRFERMAGE
ncbi:MAG TPA: TMEM175 family protein [Croceibacterium sp.]|nr:TMEM175 family protein [Croceibacterium sp.]